MSREGLPLEGDRQEQQREEKIGITSVEVVTRVLKTLLR